MKFLDQIRHFHRDCDARAIIDCACAQVPRVQVTGNDDHLFGMFATLDVADHVCAFDIRQGLGRENQFHSHWSLADQVRDQICILRCDRTGWNFRRVVCVIRLTSVRKPIVGATH